MDALGDQVIKTSIILLDLPSGNVITDFATEREAWASLRSWARDDGLEAIADLSLMRIEDGDPMLIAMEDELVHRVARDLHQADGAESRTAPIGRAVS